MDSMAMTFRFVSTVSLGVLCAFTAAASPIGITNFSFETPPTNGGFNHFCLTGTGTTIPGCMFSTIIPSWGHNPPGSVGELQPGTASFITPTKGFTVGFSTGGILSQTVSPTAQPGFTYTLMVDLGERSDLAPAFTGGANLKIGGKTFAAQGTAPTSGGWSTFQVTYVCCAPVDIGKPISIQLTSSGSEAEFDNVRLSASSPEPAGVTLLGLGLAGLLVFARRKRAS